MMARIIVWLIFPIPPLLRYGLTLKWLSKDESRHREIGLVLSKYVETLQRSNEQLVKVVTLMSKNNNSKGLSDEDKNDLLDMISKEGSESE